VSSVNEPKPCALCRDEVPLGFEFTMAFQPIVDMRDRSVYAYESLIRGVDGSSAASILDQVTDRNRYTFDQACRVTAVEMASRLGVTCYLSINFLPNAVYQASTCIRATLMAAERCNFPTDRLIFEITENERPDQAHLKHIVVEYKRQGFKSFNRTSSSWIWHSSATSITTPFVRLLSGACWIFAARCASR
jgi:EAL domain-containing protein (putative c-di-GMP-specific phosphodiesterase class I)